MNLNHERIRQSLHIITIIAFAISVIFQLRNLYLYGGKPPKELDETDGHEEEPVVEERTEVSYSRELPYK